MTVLELDEHSGDGERGSSHCTIEFIEKEDQHSNQPLMRKQTGYEGNKMKSKDLFKEEKQETTDNL